MAPGRCLGPGRLHVSSAQGHVHRLSPVRRPDVLRINKMKLEATGGQLALGPSNPRPRPRDLPSALVSRRSPSARLEPAGQVAARARPRPPAPPRRPGGAFAAVINKEGRQAHPSKSCCMRPSQPPRNVLFKTRLTNMRNLSPLCCASPLPPRALAS